MEFIDSTSLVDGWLPTAAWILGVIGVIFLLLPRQQSKWLVKAVAMAVAAGILTYALYWILLWVASVLSDPLPGAVLAWGVLGVFAVLLGLFGLRGTRAWRKWLTPLAVVAVLLLCGQQVNAYFGQYVTIGSIYGSDTAKLPTLSKNELRSPAQGARARSADIAAIQGWKAPSSMPGRGTLFQATIPGTVSGFVARRAIVYLPPAYLVARRPQLPVMVLVAGQPGSPQRWLDAGHLETLMNDFAAGHQGLAPVVVVVDPNGTLTGNTMCMDSRLGNAGTYLSKDVPAWIIGNLDVQGSTSRWTFGGFSFGGTCAIQMGAAHPDLYPNIIDLSGQVEPALAANRTVTVAKSFGGDAAAFNAQTPMAHLATRRYPHGFAYFSVGADDQHYGPEMLTISAAAKAAGMHVVTAEVPGVGHSWASARTGLAGALNLMGPRLGLAK